MAVTEPRRSPSLPMQRMRVLEIRVDVLPEPAEDEEQD